MRNLVAVLVLLATITFANAQGYHYVWPYTRSNETYVPYHYQTNPSILILKRFFLGFRLT